MDLIHSGGYQCPSNNFVCQNGKCLEQYLTCDGKDHCGDNSDETNGCISA